MLEPMMSGEPLRLSEAERAKLPRLAPLSEADMDPSTWVLGYATGQLPDGTTAPLLDPFEPKEPL